jgi:hypothetical protein
VKPKHVAVVVMFNFNKLLNGRVFISDILNIVYIRQLDDPHLVSV